MNTPGHIITSIVITGIIKAFDNYNILNPEDILIISICSILPDIDHPYSILGRLFFPLSRYIIRTFGHRTLTHSIYAVITICIVDYFFSMNGLVFIPFLSHIIIDMMSKDGVFLLYPKLDKCVIFPIQYRYNSTSQYIIISIFTGLLAISTPLMINGFWLSYNTSFVSKSNMINQFYRQQELLEVQFSERTLEGITTEKAYLVAIDGSKLYFYTNHLFTKNLADIHVLDYRLSNYLYDDGICIKSVH